MDSRNPGDCAAPPHAEPRAAAEPMILPLNDEVSLEAGGGKGANLARLARAGFAVPSGSVITTRTDRDFVSASRLENWVLETARAARSASFDAASTAIRSRFASATMSPEMIDAIRVAYAALGRPPVAVRSSATTEDLPTRPSPGSRTRC